MINHLSLKMTTYNPHNIKDELYYRELFDILYNEIGIDADEYYNNLPPLREIPNKYLYYRYMK